MLIVFYDVLNTLLSYDMG